MFTRELTPECLSQIGHIQFCPVTFQALIEKRLEIRSTFVAGEFFSVSIDSQSNPSTSTDFRRMVLLPKGNALKHEVHQLPFDVEDRLRQLMMTLQLSFGCIDMILTPDGEYIFLEVNPSGQWLWVEALTALPITKALASVLHRHAHSLSLEAN